MTQGEFVRRRGSDWELLENALGAKRQPFRASAPHFPLLYRTVVQDLNTARSENFDPYLIAKLDRLVLLGHQRLYADRRLNVIHALNALAIGFPAAVRRERILVLSFVVGFIIVSIASAFLIGLEPNVMRKVYSFEVVTNLENMYDPGADHFLRPRDVSGDADMFGFYIYNNVSIAFRTFAGGILAGIGSILFLLYNAVFLGSAAGYLSSVGSAGPFFAFVVSHGAVEVTAFVLSAVAGFRLGIALIFPPARLGRKEALKNAGRDTLPLAAGIVMLLVVAAVIEAFWSSQILPSTYKYVFGAGAFLLLFLYLVFGGRKNDV